MTGPVPWRGFPAHLGLDPVGPGVVQGACLPGRGGRVFGGHVAAHCLLAAARTGAPGRVPRSLHVHFLRAGESTSPVRYALTLLRRGRSLEHWRVDAGQADGLIATAVVVLDEPEHGAGHGVQAGPVPAPGDCPDITALAREGTEPALRHGMEIREGDVLTGGGDVAPVRDVWFRTAEPLPSDPVLAAAVFVWCSDLELTWTADLPYRATMTSRQAASLDHVVRFHTALVAGDWWLYRLTSPVLRQRRALVTGELFPDGGTVAATVSQQVLLRLTP